MEIAVRVVPRGMNWRTLLQWTALANLVAMLIAAAALQDFEPVALAVVTLAGLWALRFRGGSLGVLWLGLLFANDLFWTGLGAVSNLLHRDSLLSLLVPSALAAISMAGLVAAIGTWLRRYDPDAVSKAAPLVGQAAIALFAVVVVAGFALGSGDRLVARDGALVLGARHNKFSHSELIAQNGEVTVVVNNHDLFWHTFTVDELGVDLNVPVSAERQITFKAEPGTYRFYCKIPGHELFGMHGTLSVR